MFFAKPVATANQECQVFTRMIAGSGLRPVALNYEQDHYCVSNADKARSVRMPFVMGYSISGQRMMKYYSIADPSAHNGSPLVSIRTVWGEGLVTFHRYLLATVFTGVEIVDTSPWLWSFGQAPPDYYPAFLSPLIVHGILFETYTLAGRESPFVRKVVLPA